MNTTEKKVAEALLQIKAVMLRPDEPFTFASGWKSPIYCDNRKILSYPGIRSMVCDCMVETVNEHFKDVDLIAGVATGAIAMGALVADRMNKPFLYIDQSGKAMQMGEEYGAFEQPASDEALAVEAL